MFFHRSTGNRGMIDFVEMILMGVLATIFMGVLSIILGKSMIIRQLLRPEAIGRRTLYMFRVRFVHDNIHKTPTLNNEMSVTWLSHYLIGIGLAGVYPFLEMNEPALRHQGWMPVIVGIATVLLPWLWLYPSAGLGFLASKAPRKSPYIVASLVDYTNFELGLMIWVVFNRRVLM